MYHMAKALHVALWSWQPYISTTNQHLLRNIVMWPPCIDANVSDPHTPTAFTDVEVQKFTLPIVDPAQTSEAEQSRVKSHVVTSQSEVITHSIIRLKVTSVVVTIY